MSQLNKLKEIITKDFNIKDDVELAKAVAKANLAIEEAEREQEEFLKKHSKLKEDYVSEVKRNMVPINQTQNDKTLEPKTDVDVYAEWKKGLST